MNPSTFASGMVLHLVIGCTRESPPWLFTEIGSHSIGGKIPANIFGCSNLVRMELFRNQLVGKIPSQIGSLSKIEILSLYVNRLPGSIPSS